jgi:DMSO reductase family type II enzyme heme b subunit
MNKIILATLLIFLAACSDQRATSGNRVSEPLQIGEAADLFRQAGEDFSSPDSVAWINAREYAISLTAAPPVHASIALRTDPDIAELTVYLQAASDGETLFLRLRWPDVTHDNKTDRLKFSDGAAVQFALSGNATTSYMMGTPEEPVNIWYWKAGSIEAENLAAGGFGSTTKLPTDKLGVKSDYKEAGEWIIVFSRPIKNPGEYEVDLAAENILVALALWQGDSRQRDGFKQVSQGWITIR